MTVKGATGTAGKLRPPLPNNERAAASALQPGFDGEIASHPLASLMKL